MRAKGCAATAFARCKRGQSLRRWLGHQLARARTIDRPSRAPLGPRPSAPARRRAVAVITASGVMRATKLVHLKSLIDAALRLVEKVRVCRAGAPGQTSAATLQAARGATPRGAILAGIPPHACPPLRVLPPIAPQEGYRGIRRVLVWEKSALPR